MTYSTAGGFAAQLVEGRSASLNYSARGDANGLVVDALHGVESGNAVVNASGRVPVRFSPGNGELISVDANGTLSLQATTVPNAAFWQQLAAMTGVELRAPTLKADVSGTWSKPRGTLELTAEKAAMDPKRFARPLPSVEAVDLACVAEPDGVTLQRFTFTVERQLVRISGRLPLAEKWSELAADPMRVLGTASQLRIEVPDAEVAMFSKFLPAALAPAGRLQADLGINGGALSGFLRIHNAASRPLGPLGVLQDVNADVEFSGPRILLRRVTATTGGQPVVVSGAVDLPSSDWLAGRPGSPRYDVEIKGTNVPFVRQSALLLRGDVDLRLRTPVEGAPRISGNVVLRDSLFLSDIRAYLPRGATPSPSRRPPYFSVDIAPLNTWELDVEISGTRFMRVRMPVFAGVTSARFHLGGTLREPRAVGDATIDEGQVAMPFATFVVSQGVVRLTEENPYEPTVFVRGTGRHFGYDLAMEVSGKASAPNITFTSSPPLDSDQVLVMVMTGAAPTDAVNTSLTHRAVQIGAFFGQSMLGSLTGDPGRPDRLTIESGEKISRQGRETYSIEYELGNRWTLTGEYDEFDEYNAGFKWRLAPKKKER
jgi:translocation and assembly module TamB